MQETNQQKAINSKTDVESIQSSIYLGIENVCTVSPFGPINPVAPRIPWGPYVNEQGKRKPDVRLSWELNI